MSEKRIIRPYPGGQTKALSRSEFEVLFGGVAGPGKSFILVLDALGLQFKNIIGKAAIEFSGYRAVLFRRKTTQLSKLIDEGKKLYSGFGAEFVAHRVGEPGASHTFPSGAKIFYCHIEQEDDKENHQGLEYQYAGFDELTQFTYTQYMYLFSRTRSTIAGLFPRVRSTSNPTGKGLIWVKKRFAPDREQEVTRYFRADLENEDNYRGIESTKDDKYALSRMFIPGKLSENLTLLEKDPGYVARIHAMGARMKRALADGDWNAFGGSFFDDYNPMPYDEVENPDGMVVKPFMIPKEWRIIGSIDPGWSSPCSFGLTAKDLSGNLYRLFTYYVKRSSPHEHATEINKRIKGFEYTNGRMPELIVSGTDAFAKKDMHAILASDLTFSDIFQSAGLYLLPAKTDRVLGWWAWKQYMRDGKYFIFEGYNDPLQEEIVAAECDEKDIEDILGKGNDPNVSDHCFVRGTKVLTLNGYKRIEKIKIGELVYTSMGFQPVISTHKLINKEVYTYEINGKRLTCTPTHKFKTQKGYIPIHNLTNKDILCIFDKKEYKKCQNLGRQKLLNFTGSSLGLIPILLLQALGIITVVGATTTNLAYDTSTFTFGKKHTDVKSQMDFTYTPKMVTQIITTPIILNAKKVLVTFQNMLNYGVQRISNLLRIILPKLDHLQKNGMDQQKDLNGIENTQYKLQSKEKISFTRKIVCFAENIINPKQHTGNTAIRIVKQAHFADVYDLTVLNAHEYYVKDFLVHNSLDEQRYGIMSLYDPIQQKTDDRPEWLKKFEAKKKKQNVGVMAL